MVKAVILDLDDTLYAYEPLDIEARARVRAATCERLGMTAEEYDEAYLFGRNETKRQLGDVGASHNRLLYYQKTLEYLGVNPMPLSLHLYEVYWGTFLHNMVLYDGARELIDHLHEKEIEVMICTDLTAHIQHRKIEALGLAKDIRYLVTSEEAGREKPSPEIFQLCLRKLQLPSEEVCCIGDSLVKDVEGAKRMGMQAILFHPDEPSAPQYEAAAKMIL
ncbi:MAG: HAD family hydrolase [Eubacterium sp.]|nr:HAD family hydrolase [Eubacterium sp.]